MTMKFKIFLGFIIIGVTVLLSVSLNISNKSSSITLVMGNIEALAQENQVPTYSCSGGNYACAVVYTGPGTWDTYYKN